MVSILGSVINDEGRLVEKTKDDFYLDWSGVALLIESNKSSGEINFWNLRKKEIVQNLRIPIIITIFLSSIIFFGILLKYNNTLGIKYFISLLLLKFIGCIITGILLWYEIDNNNQFLKEICSAGKRTNCEAVLSSSGAKFFGFLNWSEIGFFYFAGSFLFLLYSINIKQESFAVLASLNLFALPFIIYSILYQWRIVKNWCILCLIIQSILIFEGLICYYGYWNSPIIYNKGGLFNSLYNLSISFIIPVLFWFFIKDKITKANLHAAIKNENNRLKYNPNIFKYLLLSQNSIASNTDGVGSPIIRPEELELPII